MFKGKSLLAVVFIGLALSVFYGLANPNKAEAAFSCSMKTPTRNGQQVSFGINWSVSPPQFGSPDYYEYRLDGGSYVETGNNPNTYTFAYGSTHTVSGIVRFVGYEEYFVGRTRKTRTWKNGYNCGSKTYTMPQPPNQPPTGSVSGSCSASGALNVLVNVSDPDGGTPGFTMHIDNVGDFGMDYGGSGWRGTWYPPRNGVTYSIFIHVVDPQTGGVYGPAFGQPFNGTYNCPPPPPPPTCSLSMNPSLVVPNGSSTLSWSTSHATSFTVDQGVGALSPIAGGSTPVSPGATSKTYTGTASGAGGSVNCSTTLTVGIVSCTLTPISIIEPGESYQPQVNVVYTAGGATNASVTVTVTVNGATRTASATLAPGANQNIDVPPPILFPAAGNFTVVTKSISGSINGNAYGPTNCGGATGVSVYYKPYLKTYGGDVWAGGGFGSGTCTSSAGAYAFAKGSGSSYQGSSSQLGVMALLSIKEFYSASQRRTLNTQGKGLSLSNTAGDATYGGAFGGNGLCISDYYTDTQDSTLSQGNLGGNPAVGLNQYTRPANSTLAASATVDVPLGSQSVVYVDGDIRINGNVTYASGAANRTQLPFFALIARGNIYIDASVTRLDGLYIAQPSNFASPTNGKIYTCAQSVNTLYSLAALYNACNTQLTVNGALIAHQVKFLRTRGSLFGSTIEEIPNFLTGAGTNASEVINYTPEMYLAPSPLKNSSNPGGSTSTGSYDAIFSLPPVY